METPLVRSIFANDKPFPDEEPVLQDLFSTPLVSGSRRGDAPIGATPYRRPIPYVQDAQGHEHKGKGPGGGQFVSSNGEDRPQDSGRSAETKPNKVNQESFKTPDADTTERVRDLAARNLAESWQVSPEDLAELAKEDRATYSTKEDAAWEFLRSWASSSGGPIPTAAATAVCDSLGLPYKFHSDGQAKINDYIRKRPALNRATTSFGKAMYDVTQKWLAERGITEVELVRGGANPDETGQPASSWSTSMAGVRGADRGLYREKIPAWRILSVPSTGFGTLHESEVVVLPKPSQSQAVQDSYGRPLAYAKAPKGGVTVQGQFYPGGQFIPAEVLVNATEEERRAVESGESRGKPLPPEGGVKETKQETSNSWPTRISQAVKNTFGVDGKVQFKTDQSGKMYGEHGENAVVVNPQLGDYPAKSLNFKPSPGVTETAHLIAHELVHKAFSEDSALGHEMKDRLSRVNAKYGSSVSMYGAFAGAFENLIELGAAYSHSPEELREYSQEMYDIAKEWATRVNKSQDSTLLSGNKGYTLNTPLEVREMDPRKMNHEQLQSWLDERIQEARDFRVAKGKPPMTKSEESALWDRFRQSAAR